MTTTNERRADLPAGRSLDRLSVTGIEAVGHHGVLDFERRDGQVFTVDLTLGLDTSPAAGSGTSYAASGPSPPMSANPWSARCCATTPWSCAWGSA